MLITQNLEDPILYEPALLEGRACNSLKIITAFTDCERMLSHLISLKDGLAKDNKIYASGIKIEVLLGMRSGSSLTKKKHNNICNTINQVNSTIGMPKISCSYIYTGKEVHSKIYIWSKAGTPEIAYCGSANYTMNAFRKRRECMTSCDPKEAMHYYRILKKDTVNCLSSDVENKIKFSTDDVISEETDKDNLENLNFNIVTSKDPLDKINISLLTTKGDVGHGSGVNWGIRPDGTKRDRNQAYIPYNKPDQKKDFFPDRTNPTDKNCPLFKVVTRESGAFYMRLAQENNKAIQSADSNAIIGRWLRNKLNIPSGEFITKEMLENYGSTHVVFKKYENNIYTLEFEPDTEKT